MNHICVEDGIDSSKDSGKLMISVLSAVAEIERENIRTQTMAGREQKACEGKWNGGFAPYGYRLENGKLLIAEHINEGISGVAKYLNTHGYVKKLRQNGTITGFSASFVKDVLDNPVYMGKIAYGRRKTEKKLGTRNEMHIVEQSEFPIYDGQHEARLRFDFHLSYVHGVFIIFCGQSIKKHLQISMLQRKFLSIIHTDESGAFRILVKISL